jgi:hypothetical protein
MDDIVDAGESIKRKTKLSRRYFHNIIHPPAHISAKRRFKGNAKKIHSFIT